MTVESYLQKISEESPLDYLSQFICPHLVGREWEWIRRATLLMMATQSDKHIRVRAHILLCGEPGTGKSIKGEAKILVLIDGKIKSVMIKNLENKNNYKALSVNPTTLKTEWKKAYHFIKHIEKRKMLKIKTKGKQEVVATKDHSFLKYDFVAQQLMPVRGDDLSVGDILPFISRFECDNIQKFHHGFDHTFTFGFLVGLWIAEGCLQKENIIRFSNNDLKLLNSIGEEYNGHVYKYASKGGDMHIFNKNLNGYLRNYLEKYPIKHASHHKKIPDFCFNTPKAFRKGLISGYFTGDGTVDKSEISMTTVSKCLAYGITHVLSSLRISSYVRLKKRKTGEYYDIIIHSSSINDFIKKIDIKHKNKKNKLIERGKRNRWQSLVNIPLNKDMVKKYSKGLQARNSDSRNHINKILGKNCKKGYIGRDTARKTNKFLNSPELKKLIDADIHWMPITSIEEINSDGYVYDISVEDNENFVLENGMVVHNTEFLLWMREHLQGIMINAEFTSKVGLVGDARGNTIKPGLLADYDGNVILVDELDKMPAIDQNGLLQAMEEGQYTIVKGKSRQRFDSEVRVIGCANDLKKIQKPLLDRFDFVLFVRPSKRNERANNVKRIMNTFAGKEETRYVKVIQGYLKWIDGYETTIHDSEEEAINNIIKEYILHTQTKIDSVSYRSLELSILRIAYAMAKLEKRNIGREHVKTAVRVKDQILKNLVG